MSSRKIVVELRPSRLDVVLYDRTKRVATRRVPLDLPSDVAAWMKAVRQCDSHLRDAVKEFDVKEGTGAIVLYRSPSQSVDLCSLPIKSAAQAVEAARLECLDSLSYTDASPVCEATVVGRDRRAEARNTHVIVASDRDDVITSIVAMVEEAGLKFESATPIEAVLMARMACEALARCREPVAQLYVGESSSYFFLSGNDALLFGRRIGVGLDSLLSSLTRPIRAAKDGELIELSADQAQDILFRCGVPKFDQVVSEQPPLTGRHIVPVMQPILQRLVVEMRQSLRFGLPAEFQAAPAIAVKGPGSRLPGLSAMLTAELEVQTTNDERYVEFDHMLPGSRGSELVDALRDETLLSDLNLQPLALTRSRSADRMKRWLWTGAAAGLVLLGIDFASYESMLSDARARVESASNRDAIEQAQRMQERLAAGIAAIHQVENSIIEELGAQPDYRALLHELSRLTPPSIRFASISLNVSEGRTNGAISGYATRVSAGDSGGSTLAAFIESLRASPLFTSVGLGNVQSGSVGEQAGERFDARFVAVDVAARGLQAPLATAAASEDAP